MKNANKRLLISIAALVIAIALAATTTFAWFTMDTTPEVNDIDLAVTTQDGLYVALTSALSEIRTNITVTDDDATAKKLDAVRLNKPNELNAADAFTKITDGTIGIVKNEQNEYDPISSPSSDVYSRSFYISSQSNYSVHISKIKIDATNPNQNIVAWRDFTAEADGFVATKGSVFTISALVQNAIRVGFAVDNKMVKVVNPNSGAGWEAITKINAAHDYFKTVTNMTVDEKNAFDDEETWTTPYNPVITQEQLASYLVSADTTIGNTEDNRILETLGTPTNGWFQKEIKVYIWAEGADPDCFNEILKTSFKVSIEFSGTYTPNT